MMGNLTTVWQRLASSLRARILLPTVVLFVVTLAAMVISTVQLYAADMGRSHTEKAELFADMVAGGLKGVMLQGKPQQVGDVLEVIRSHRVDLESVSLIRPDGSVGHSSKAELIGTIPWEDIRSFAQTTLVRAPRGNPAEYAVVRPIPNEQSCSGCHGTNSRVVGWLDLRFTRNGVTAANTKLARTLALSAGMALVCLLAISGWIIRREVVKPITRLVSAMRRAEAGDLAVRADEGRPDELGVAARGFDAALAALRRSQAELEAFYHERMVRADRFAAVGEVATGLAHEIKNPLAGLSGALELLAEDLGESARQAAVVTEMRHQVSRLTHTMESLLSFARPPKAKLRVTDIDETIEKVLFLVRQQARGGSITVRHELGEKLPPVLADPDQLEQVLLNISLNACQAMGTNGGTLVIRSSVSESRLTIEVEDTGPGIPADARPHMFKPFFTTKREGNGLGLAICARIVAEHGGNIGFRCPVGGGTVFAVTLRQVRQAQSAERAVEHAA